MALPVFDTAKYKTNLPSTGETVEYRPFVVKEQKILLMATQASVEEQVDAVYRAVDACTFGKLRVADLPSFDVEYLFLQIRARSVGEKIDMVLTCGCEAKQNSTLDITTVEVQREPGHSNVIELGNGVMVKMRYPTMKEVDSLAQNRTVDGVIGLVAKSIDSIWQDDEMYAALDYSLAELIEFVENLSPASLEKIERFFVTAPVLRHDLSWTCKECSKINAVTLEGIQSFFG
jgi:hypothetical protein